MQRKNTGTIILLLMLLLEIESSFLSIVNQNHDIVLKMKHFYLLCFAGTFTSPTSSVVTNLTCGSMSM